MVISSSQQCNSFLLQKILTQLRTIFDLIIQFQSIQDKMYQSANDELILRQLFEDRKGKKTEQVTCLET